MPAQKSVKHKLTRRKSASRRRRPGYFIRRAVLFGILALLLWAGWQLFSSWRDRVWREGTRVTFVVARNTPVLYSFSPQSRKLLIFEIPATTQIEAAGGYGTFLAGKLWELGQQKGKGGELLRLSMQRSLGIPVDAWIGGEGEEFFSHRPLPRIAAIKEAVLGSVASNLTFFDRLAILLDISPVPLADRRTLDLEASRVLKKDKLPDGVEGFIIVPEQARLVFDALRDELVVAEGKTLTVVNATAERGLAGKVADVVAVLGVRVVAVQSEEEKEGVCIIRGKKEDLSTLSSRRLRGLFHCKLEEGSPQGASSLEILLERDFADKF